MRSKSLAMLTAFACIPVPAMAADSGPTPAATADPKNWPAARSVGLIDAKTEAFVTALMARMSVEEKVGQTIQADIGSIKVEDLARYPLGSILAGGSSGPVGHPDRSRAGPWIETARAFRAASLKTRLAIPVIFGIDAVHGHGNVVGATIFPHNIALGAANDPALVRRIGEATARETVATGIDWAFGPTVTVPRDDRWGRTYEGYSEDPALVRSYAGEIVRGLQGDVARGGLLQAGRVAASAKHFLGDGGTTRGTDQGDTAISEADLIKVHAQGYVTAINAGALTVMASFNSWNGQKLHGSRSLLTDVLKGRMGFDGFVVGDWNGHGQVTGCTPQSCAASFNAGVDMFMAPDSWKPLFDNTLAQVKAGEITMARLDDAVRRILRVKVKLGLFEAGRPWEGRDVIGAADHRALAREAVRKSLVLLKNNGVLPLKAGANILVAGDAADDIGKQAGGWTLSWQGTGNTNADFPGGTSIYAGLKNAVEAAGGSATLSADGSFTRKPDVAVVVFGENPYAEGLGDVQTLEYQSDDKTDLALLKRLKAAGIPVVALFVSGRPLWTNPEINASDAFVAIWQPGSEGAGVADVIVGDATGRPRGEFTGKLSYSWPRTAAQTPLNVGDARYDPLFAYGFGMTYKSPQRLGTLPEVSGVDPSMLTTLAYFKGGRLPKQLRFVPSGGATITPVDADMIQEAGRRFTFTGPGRVALALMRPLDMRFYSNTDLSLSVSYRVDQAPAAAVALALGGGRVDLTPTLRGAPAGEWRTIKVKLKCFDERGANIDAVTEPFAIETTGPATISLRTVELVTETDGAVCPAAPSR